MMLILLTQFFIMLIQFHEGSVKIFFVVLVLRCTDMIIDGLICCLFANFPLFSWIVWNNLQRTWWVQQCLCEQMTKASAIAQKKWYFKIFIKESILNYTFNWLNMLFCVILTELQRKSFLVEHLCIAVGKHHSNVLVQTFTQRET